MAESRTMRDSSICDDDELIDDGLRENSQSPDTEPVDDDNNKEENVSEKKKGCGKDLDWEFFMEFENLERYKESVIKKELEDSYSLRKTCYTFGSTKEIWACKFSRRINFKECKSKYRVTFSNSTESIYIERTASNHLHEEIVRDEDDTEGKRNYRWTKEQTKLVMDGVRDGLTPTIIMRILQRNGIPLRGLTKKQLYYKVNDCNRKRVETDFIIDTGTLREEISKISKEPVDLRECFVCYSEVIDDVEGEDPRFCIIWTSKQLQARVDDSMTQDDCTYRLTWQVSFLDCLFNWTNYLHYFSW